MNEQLNTSDESNGLPVRPAETSTQPEQGSAIDSVHDSLDTSFTQPLGAGQLFLRQLILQQQREDHAKEIVTSRVTAAKEEFLAYLLQTPLDMLAISEKAELMASSESISLKELVAVGEQALKALRQKAPQRVAALHLQMRDVHSFSDNPARALATTVDISDGYTSLTDTLHSLEVGSLVSFIEKVVQPKTVIRVDWDNHPDAFAYQRYQAIARFLLPHSVSLMGQVRHALTSLPGATISPEISDIVTGLPNLTDKELQRCLSIVVNSLLDESLLADRLLEHIDPVRLLNISSAIRKSSPETKLDFHTHTLDTLMAIAMLATSDDMYLSDLKELYRTSIHYRVRPIIAERARQKQIDLADLYLEIASNTQEKVGPRARALADYSLAVGEMSVPTLARFLQSPSSVLLMQSVYLLATSTICGASGSDLLVQRVVADAARERPSREMMALLWLAREEKHSGPRSLLQKLFCEYEFSETALRSLAPAGGLSLPSDIKDFSGSYISSIEVMVGASSALLRGLGLFTVLDMMQQQGTQAVNGSRIFDILRSNHMECVTRELSSVLKYSWKKEEQNLLLTLARLPSLPE
jgi:hypothetical protein